MAELGPTRGNGKEKAKVLVLILVFLLVSEHVNIEYFYITDTTRDYCNYEELLYTHTYTRILHIITCKYTNMQFLIFCFNSRGEWSRSKAHLNKTIKPGKGPHLLMLCF